MITCSVRDVLASIASRAGQSVDSLDRDQVAAWMTYIHAAVRRALDVYRWPSYTLVEWRRFQAGEWTATTYAGGGIVYLAEAYWIATEECLAGDVPGTSAKWERTEQFRRLIPWSQTASVIERPYAAFAADPRVVRGPREWRIGLIDGLGVDVLDDVLGVWLVFRKPMPSFIATAWDDLVAYASGARVYFADDGQVYEATATTAAGESPATAAAKWQLVPFPEFLRPFAVESALADWHEDQGAQDKARPFRMRAEQLLDDEVYRVAKTNRHVTRWGQQTGPRNSVSA